MDDKAHIERLVSVVTEWGMLLLNEGRITINQYRSALGFGDADHLRVQEHPILEDYRA